MVRNIVFLIAASCCFTSGYSQSVKDSLSFRKPLLFEEFINGTVLMKTGAIESAPLNYNTDDQSIVFINNGRYMTLTGIDQVDTVYIQGKKYVPVRGSFYEIISSGNLSLFVSFFNKTHPVTATVTKDGNVRKDDSQVSNTVSDVYISRAFKGNYDVQIFAVYFLKRGDKLFEFKNPKQFVKAFSPDARASILQFIESNHIKFNNDTDLISLMNYCNSQIKE